VDFRKYWEKVEMLAKNALAYPTLYAISAQKGLQLGPLRLRKGKINGTSLSEVSTIFCVHVKAL
jgi:hypothetical protein